MRAAAALVVAICLSACWPALAQNATNNNGTEQLLIVFGDSLSDTGNRFVLSNGSEPNPQYYFFGRFSDGPVWVDDVANSSIGAGWRVINYAVGGARACDPTQPEGQAPNGTSAGNKTTLSLINAQILNLTQQVDLYLSGVLPPAYQNLSDSTITFGGNVTEGTNVTQSLINITLISSNSSAGNGSYANQTTAGSRNITVNGTLISIETNSNVTISDNSTSSGNSTGAAGGSGGSNSTSSGNSTVVSPGSLPYGQQAGAVMVMIGGNDYLGALMDATLSRENITDALSGLPNQTATCIARNVERLLNSSAIAPNGTLIVSTLPPIQSVPLVRTPATEGLEEVVAASAEAQRQALVTELEGLAARYPQRIVLFHLFNDSNILLANASDYLNISVTNTSCVQYGALTDALAAAIQINPAVLTNNGTGDDSGGIFGSISDVIGHFFNAVQNATSAVAAVLGLGDVGNADQISSLIQAAVPYIESGGALGPARNNSANGTDSSGSSDGAGGLLQQIVSTAFGTVTQVCPNPVEHFFWDGVHPTTRVHQVLAYLIMSHLNNGTLDSYTTDTKSTSSSPSNTTSTVNSRRLF